MPSNLPEQTDTIDAELVERVAEEMFLASLAQAKSAAGEFGPVIAAFSEAFGIKSFADVPASTKENWYAMARAAILATRAYSPHDPEREGRAVELARDLSTRMAVACVAGMTRDEAAGGRDKARELVRLLGGDAKP